MPVNLVSRVLLPTDGKPTSPTRVSPDCKELSESHHTVQTSNRKYLGYVKAITGFAAGALRIKKVCAKLSKRAQSMPVRYVPLSQYR